VEFRVKFQQDYSNITQKGGKLKKKQRILVHAWLMAGGSKIIYLIGGRDKEPRKMEETESVYKVERQRIERGYCSGITYLI
jgi:hypothetical protein